MAKRFTATDKWDDPWFFKLSDKNKLIWLFLLDKCDHAGIWKVNFEIMKAYTGVDKPDTSPFEGRIKPLSDEEWYIPKFVEFQYGELKQENRAHRSVLSLLLKKGIKPLTSPFQGAKDKDKDKDKEEGGVGETKQSVLDATKRPKPQWDMTVPELRKAGLM